MERMNRFIYYDVLYYKDKHRQDMEDVRPIYVNVFPPLGIILVTRIDEYQAWLQENDLHEDIDDTRWEDHWWFGELETQRENMIREFKLNDVEIKFLLKLLNRNTWKERTIA